MSTGPKQDPSQVPGIAHFFLVRTTFALLLTTLFILGGVFAYISLVKESLPDLAIPQATVTTNWGGADPQTIEQQVTKPIETELKSLKGLKKLTSASFASVSIVAVEFDANADLADAMQRLRTKVDDAAVELPKEVEKSTINQVAVDDRPIVTVVLSGNVDTAVLSRTAEELQDRLERVRGVNEVVLGGLREEVVHIRLNPSRLIALGISPLAVRDAVNTANIDMPWGEIESENIGGTVRLIGRFRDLEDLKSLPITRFGEGGTGRTVRLSEIAEVRRDLEKEASRADLSWKGAPFVPSIEVSIKKVPGADTLQVVKDVRAELAEATAVPSWPHGLNHQVTQSQAEDITDSLSDVLINGLQAMLAVFAVLFLLLSWREGLIAGLAIPLTFMGALATIYMLGYTLNELVIIGMVLALGLLVDVFILMMEGMHESIFIERKGFAEAAYATLKRFGLPALAGTLTTVLALAPLMGIGGTAGKFISVLPVTAITCLTMAFIVAVLVTLPMSKFVLSGVASTEGDREMAIDRITRRAGDWLRNWSLGATLRSRWTAAATAVGAVGVFVVSTIAFSSVPATMWTEADGLKLGITVELPSSTTLATSEKVGIDLGDILRTKPYLESVVRLIGQKSPFAVGTIADSLTPQVDENFVGFSATFVPREDRDHPSYDYADILRSELAKVLHAKYAGAKLIVVTESGGPGAADPIQVVLTGANLDRLREIANAVQAKLSQVPGAVDIRDNIGLVSTKIELKPKREAVDFYGLNLQDLASQVRIAMTEDEIGKFVVGDNRDDLPIKLGLSWASRAGDVGGPTRMEELVTLRAMASNGKPVSLLSLVDPVIDTNPVSITHEGGRRAITVLGKTDGRPVTEIMDAFRPELEKMNRGWPSGYDFAITGEAQETAETFASAGAMLMLALVLILATLVLLYNSFAQAFIILAAIPLALVGTFLGFAATGMPFSFFAMVGMISLIGIVANDSIVMVDTMNRHRDSGMAIAEAAARGASDRLRPILSTTITTIIGLVPLAISNPMFRPLCMAVIFGLLAATVLALVVVPALYLIATRSTVPKNTTASDVPGELQSA